MIGDRLSPPGGRSASEKTLLIRKGLADMDAIGANAVFAQLVGVVAERTFTTAMTPKSAGELDLALHDDRVRQGVTSVLVQIVPVSLWW